MIIVYNTYKLMFLDDWSRDFFELANISFNFRVYIVVLVLLNLAISIFFEYFASRIFSRWWYKNNPQQLINYPERKEEVSIMSDHSYGSTNSKSLATKSDSSRH